MNNPLDGIDSTAKPLSEQIALQLRGMIFDQTPLSAWGPLAGRAQPCD